MKKFLYSMVIVIALTLSLSSCNKEDITSSSASLTQEEKNDLLTLTQVHLKFL